jgi:transcriptional regulator with XRE-family HTH domain
MGQEINQPYKLLGQKIKSLRKSFDESIKDVSSAVEIDPSELLKIESGLIRPSEEVLIQIISHFNLSDNEALSFWQLANYDNQPAMLNNITSNLFSKLMNDNQVSNLIMLFPVEQRPFYSDHLEIILGESGLVINFNQKINNQVIPISKIGMSLEQAKVLYQTLESALLQSKYNSGPKKLNSPKNKK